MAQKTSTSPCSWQNVFRTAFNQPAWTCDLLLWWALSMESPQAMSSKRTANYSQWLSRDLMGLIRILHWVKLSTALSNNLSMTVQHRSKQNYTDEWKAPRKLVLRKCRAIATRCVVACSRGPCARQTLRLRTIIDVYRYWTGEPVTFAVPCFLETYINCKSN